MADAYKKLVSGINPTTGSGTTEWFEVPAGHQYQGYVRVLYNGASGGAATEYTIYGLSATGTAVSAVDIEARNTLNYGECDTYNFDMGEGEVLAVGSDSTLVTFAFRGLDIG